jgi:DinB superfamily
MKPEQIWQDGIEKSWNVSLLMSDITNELKRTIEATTPKLLNISESESERARAVGKWSPKEILGHLIDSAANNHIRFVKAQFDDDLIFPGYDQERWVSTQRYNAERWKELVELWRQYNSHLAHVVEGIPGEILQKRRARHNLHQVAWQAVPESEPTTLEYFVQDYIAHMKNHLRQILGDRFES